MTFVGSYEQKRTFDPERGLELLPDPDGAPTGSSGYEKKKIVGEGTIIRFYVKPSSNFRLDDKSRDRPDKRLIFHVLYYGQSDLEKEIIKEALLADKHGWGTTPPMQFSYGVMFEDQQ